MATAIERAGDATSIEAAATADGGANTPAAPATAFTAELVDKELSRFRLLAFVILITGTALLIGTGYTLIKTVLGNLANLTVIEPEFAAIIITCLLVGAYLLRTSSRMTLAVVNECDKQQRLSRRG